MGKTYSVEKKSEELIIAQNGANGASTSHMEYKLEILGIAVTAIAVIFCMVCILTVYKLCVHKTKRLFHHAINTPPSISVTGVLPQPRPTNYNNV